jgi:hypothetical protein
MSTTKKIDIGPENSAEPLDESGIVALRQQWYLQNFLLPFPSQIIGAVVVGRDVFNPTHAAFIAASTPFKDG